MDIVTILQNVPLSVAIVIVAYLLGKTALGIIKVIAESRASIATDESQRRRIADELDAATRIKAAELALETARILAEERRVQHIADAKTAQKLDEYQTNANEMRLATSTTLLATNELQAETVKALILLGESQSKTLALVSGSETHVIASVEGARDDIIEGLLEYRRMNIIVLDMLLQDPPAGRTRIKRAMKAFAEGDIVGAQAVANETEPKTSIEELPKAS